MYEALGEASAGRFDVIQTPSPSRFVTHDDIRPVDTLSHRTINPASKTV